MKVNWKIRRKIRSWGFHEDLSLITQSSDITGTIQLWQASQSSGFAWMPEVRAEGEQTDVADRSKVLSGSKTKLSQMPDSCATGIASEAWEAGAQA